MRKFVVEVYSDNDITEQAIYVELLGRFGNMIASVKEEAAQQSVQSDGEDSMYCKCASPNLNILGMCLTCGYPRR